MKRTIVALFAALVILPIAVQGQTDRFRLSSKQLAKIESIIDQLEQLPTQPAEQSTRLRKLWSSVGTIAARLPEGDIKTDLETAAYWYEEAARDRGFSSDYPRRGCYAEKPGAYQTLCEDFSGSGTELILAKAQLHLGWVKALVSFHKTGSRDPQLGEIKLERMNDRLLAARAIDLLKVLESDVITYDSLADFQDGAKLARVSFEVFQQHLEKISVESALILSWLPPDKLKSEINNALLSYQDGGFWWQKTYSPKVIHVSHFTTKASWNATDTNYLCTVPYTIAINWRHGSRYIKRAEKILESYGSEVSSTTR
ncbi:MAG: hypothetical protein ACRD8U_20810 [Pyrinomonadaceae bacterium]